MPRNPSIHNRPVMVIEDDIILGEVLLNGLTSEGYKVDWCTTWKQGAQLLSEQVPDVLIMDLNLPDADGMAVLRDLREHSRTRDIAVVITSGRSSIEDLRSGIESGALYYLTKPYELEDLITKVRSAIFQRFEMYLGFSQDQVPPKPAPESPDE